MLKNRVYLIDGRIEFAFPYNFEQKEFVKLDLGCRYDADCVRGKVWFTFPERVTLDRINEYAREFGAYVENSVLLHYCGLAESKRRSEERRGDGAGGNGAIHLSGAPDASDVALPELDGFAGDELFPFQRVGVRYALDKKRCIIGDDMGLGKTLQALAVIHCARLEKTIVVCPATIKLSWQRAIYKAFPKRAVQVWDSKTGSVYDNPNFIVINYDNLDKRLDELVAFGADCIVLDEVHYLKTATAKRTRAAAKLCRRREYVLGLTGTPILNRPVEITSPLSLIGHLNDFGGYKRFVARYCNAHLKPIWVKPKNGGPAYQRDVLDVLGASNLEELSTYLRERCMIRRKKIEVLKDLPAKLRAQVALQIVNRERYDEAEDDIARFLQAEVDLDKEFLASIAHLPPNEKADAIEARKIEKMEAAEGAKHLVQIEKLKQLACEGIYDQTVAWVTDFLESGEKFVLFVHHTEYLYKFLNEFPGVARIVADDDPFKRQAEIDRFVSNPECRLMVASLKAGGTGVDTLQGACSNVGFFELDWTPAVMLQAEDRVHRIGQKDQVTAWYFIAENTIMEAMQEMLAEKQAICDTVLDGDEYKYRSVFNELMKDYFKTRRLRHNHRVAGREAQKELV